jgi:hypothetical protein
VIERTLRNLFRFAQQSGSVAVAGERSPREEPQVNRTQAKRASQTLEDVFTVEGDAVVIDRLFTFSRINDGDTNLAGKGQCARVTGQGHHGEWIAISELTAKEDL